MSLFGNANFISRFGNFSAFDWIFQDLVILQDLVTRMLHINPRVRLTAEQVIFHPWITKVEELPTYRLSFPEPVTVKVSDVTLNYEISVEKVPQQKSETLVLIHFKFEKYSNFKQVSIFWHFLQKPKPL